MSRFLPIFAAKYLAVTMDKLKNFDPEGKYDFYKQNETDTIWWLDIIDRVGEFVFSFDRETIFNLFADYPAKLTAEQKQTFDRENPYWAEFFKNR